MRYEDLLVILLISTKSKIPVPLELLAFFHHDATSYTPGVFFLRMRGGRGKNESGQKASMVGASDLGWMSTKLSASYD